MIAIGGGGIQPMRARWEQVLQKWDAEMPNLQQQTSGAGERIATRTQELKGKAQEEMAATRNGGSAA